ncbi:Histidine decarboxylase [Aquicella siphonis]|uniref:Histidine decarboxylase n=1 Tax=Aquicella siphonis TaxID=254247 RepID=A0A5E4PHU9_9COXI|nr:pyridoxal-dependent decarboxylase [Aquicella siphonis]VVC75901.1 Histidine decarboxylase [Aquicella siphonis]
MWKKSFPFRHASNEEYRIDDYKALLRYVNQLAAHKLGYPVSLLTYLGIVNNQILGIKPGTLANVLLNNVGDPFKDSETSLLEVKKHEREIISIFERFYGLPLNEARGYVTTGGTEGNFASLWWSKRYLINNTLDMLIEKDNLIKLQHKQEQELEAALAKIPINDYRSRVEHLQKIIDIKDAIASTKNIVQQLLTPTVFYCKGHTHYSIPKVSEILRLNIRPIQPNDDGSISLTDLKKELLLHAGANPHSGVIVIANIGTTITGAIDDVPNIKKLLLETLPIQNYTIHMDGALTGFVLPIIKPFGNVENYFTAIGVNTLAVSAHKYPGLSQPCGIILAQKDFFNKAFEKSERSIEYVGNIVDVTITGSRSGLNVLMFHNALRSLGLDKGTEKLTLMVRENLDNAKYLYQELVKMYGQDKVYYPHQFNVIFPRPSQELAKKYQLMLTGDNATICVLTNATRKLINEFLKDLNHEKESAMNKTITKTEYTIHTLQEEHVKSTVELFTKSFCDSEPITRHLNVRYQDYEPFAREVVQKAIKEGLSKVAINRQNRVIACTIAEDMADPFIPHAAHYPKLKPVFALLDELSKPFTAGKKFVPGKIVHVWIAAVDQAYRGLGLSTEIDIACVEGAARKGYDFAYAEFTNPLSEKVTSQFKILQLYNKIQYDDFVWENSSMPFKGLEGAAASYVATIRPGVKLDSLPNCYASREHVKTD